MVRKLQRMKEHMPNGLVFPYFGKPMEEILRLGLLLQDSGNSLVGLVGKTALASQFILRLNKKNGTISNRRRDSTSVAEGKVERVESIYSDSD